MDNDERTKRNALMDWQQERDAQKSRLPFLDGAEKTACEARINECNAWIAKIRATL
jgi:ribosomal protein L19E